MSLKIKQFNWSNIIFLILVLIIFGSIATIKIENRRIDVLVIITFLAILLISLYEIYKDKMPYSLNKTFWYFNLIFYFIAPLIQYLSNYYEWGYSLSNEDYIWGNCLILLSMLVYLLVYRRVKKINIKATGNIKINVKNTTIIILFFVSIVCFVIAIKNIGLSSLFSRSENSYNLVGDSMFNTIFTHLLKCIPVYAFVISYLQNGKLNFLNMILLFEIFILNFPTSTTRFWMGAIFIGIFLLVFNKKSLNNRIYDIILLVTFTVIFSFLYIFKFYDLDYILKEGIKFETLTESYNSVDYDAYSITPTSKHYVENFGYVNGRQLIGTIFFMIPRSIWTSKPYPSGSMLAEAQGQHYTNISCPFIVEGYLNFGIFGIIIFQLILGLICRKLDSLYWNKNSKNFGICYKILYPFLMGFLIYAERGALHPFVVYLFCFCIPIVAYYGIKLIINQKEGSKKKNYDKDVNYNSSI